MLTFLVQMLRRPGRPPGQPRERRRQPRYGDARPVQMVTSSGQVVEARVLDISLVGLRLQPAQPVEGQAAPVRVILAGPQGQMALAVRLVRRERGAAPVYALEFSALGKRQWFFLHRYLGDNYRHPGLKACRPAAPGRQASVPGSHLLPA